MRRRNLIALLAAITLVTIWGLAASSQVIDSTPCQQACYEQKAACVTECGTHANPIECEAGCHEQLEDCLPRCS